MKNKIGAFIGYNSDTNVMAEFRKAADMGLECCQLGGWDINSYTDEGAEKIKAASAETGIEITALWAGWSGPKEWNFYGGPATLGIVPQAYREIRLRELYAGADFAYKLGVTDIITHVGFIPENPFDPDFNGTVCALRNLAQYLSTRGQYFLFESGQETPVTMLRAIEEIGTGNLGVNFDTANLILYGKANSADALDVIGKYVRNTHCKDGFYPTTGKQLGREVALGEGKADFPKIVRKLKELNYTGPYVIEREISGEEQKKDIIRARDFIASLLAD
jgi:sugar phosphate isomerase/epimerase